MPKRHRKLLDGVLAAPTCPCRGLRGRRPGGGAFSEWLQTPSCCFMRKAAITRATPITSITMPVNTARVTDDVTG